MIHKHKIISFSDLTDIRKKTSAEGKKIVFSSGCYDLMHISHTIALNGYKQLGDILVISVGRDSIVSQLKGPSRPINPELHRLYTLAALQDVDYVILGESKLYQDTSIDFYETLKELKPDILGIPPDDSNFLPKQKLCQELGITLKTVKRSPYTSTTDIIRGAKLRNFKAPLRIDFAGGWTDIPYLVKGTKGYVTNVALKPHIILEDGEFNFGDYPRGIGLSTSTAAKLLELIQLRGGQRYLANRNPKKISEDLFKLENLDINWAIGRQDMYSIVHGGLNCFEFEDNNVRILPKIPEPIIKKLEANTLLLYIGQSRNAQKLVEEIYSNFNSGHPRYLQVINTISQCGLDFYLKLKDNNFPACSSIMNRNWEAQKIITPSATNQYIDDIHHFAMNNGAWGGKLGGAGGGGCFVFLTPNKATLKAKLEKQFSFSRSINFAIETKNIIDLNINES